MLVYPDIDPVFLSLGPINIHWYGVMYMLAFVFFYFMGAWRCRHNGNRPFHPDYMGDYLFYLILGVIIGGRLGHVIFYNPAYYFENPIDIILIYKGGMSFHGGFIGVIVALWLFSRRSKAPVLNILDLIATDMPIGLMLGRIGNFINGELWGRVTDVPWAMVFPHVDNLPRHPSMLYEAVLEGPVLWLIILSWRRWINWRVGDCALIFCVGYALIRFLVEYVREPEVHLGVHDLYGVGMTMGQILSLMMVVLGGALFVWRIYWRRSQPAGQMTDDRSGTQQTKAGKKAGKKNRNKKRRR